MHGDSTILGRVKSLISDAAPLSLFGSGKGSNGLGKFKPQEAILSEIAVYKWPNEPYLSHFHPS